MADARGDHDHIALLEPVALGAHQILHICRAVAEEDLIEIVGVEIHPAVGPGHVLMRVHIPGGHFQFLVDINTLPGGDFGGSIRPGMGSCVTITQRLFR